MFQLLLEELDILSLVPKVNKGRCTLPLLLGSGCLGLLFLQSVQLREKGLVFTPALVQGSLEPLDVGCIR